MRVTKFLLLAALTTAMAGCASGKINYTQYQHKIMLCEQMGMEIYTVQAYDAKNGIIYTKDVVCKDKYGGTWSSGRM